MTVQHRTVFVVHGREVVFDHCGGARELRCCRDALHILHTSVSSPPCRVVREYALPLLTARLGTRKFGL